MVGLMALPYLIDVPGVSITYSVIEDLSLFPSKPHQTSKTGSGILPRSTYDLNKVTDEVSIEIQQDKTYFVNDLEMSEPFTKSKSTNF